jgi:hypothetical protein
MDQARYESAPMIDSAATQLPNSSSYMATTVRIKKAGPRQVGRMILPKTRRQMSIIFAPSCKMFILRDDSSGVRQMREAIRKADP